MPPITTIISDAPTSNSGSVKPLCSRRRRLKIERTDIARLREVGADGSDVVAVREPVAAWIGIRGRVVTGGVVALRVLHAVPVDAVERDRVAAGRGGPGERLRA